MYYEIKIAGHPVIYKFHDKKTHLYFTNRIAEYKGEVNEPVIVPEELISKYQEMSDCRYSYAEYMSALYTASNTLMRYDCCCYHSAAVCVNGKGYLITGVSGTGKTTQYLNLRKLFPEHVKIINGDKPFLEFADDGTVIHTSPWRGKEDFGSDITCKLHGIVFLRQSDRNFIFRMKPETAVFSSLQMFLYNSDSEEAIRKVCELDRKLLKDIPMWYFLNKGDLESSDMLFNTVLNGGDKNG